jgi:putative serine protease PepD
VPLVGTAAAAALLASIATAGFTGAFGADDAAARPTSLADVAPASSAVPVVDSTSDDPDWERVAASVSASVVAIQVRTANGGGEGSGVIIDDAGRILTNNHVVAGARNDTVQVTLTDGRLFDATVVGTDPSTDLAVIQLQDAPDDLSPATLGDSDDVAVGAPVMAVGNPLGLANTVTTGIISALDRPVSASSGEPTTAADVVVTNAIQIDAAINPGNSGGPLFDAQGRVIGITSSIATLSNGSQSGSIGLGFAIPVNLARSVGEQLIEDGTAEHAFLGVSLSDGTATADDVSRRGAVVEQVTSGSPAESAGIEVGDVVVAIDGDAVAGSESLTAYVRERRSGQEATLTIVRDGEALEVPVTLATRELPAASGDGQNSTEEGESGEGSSDDGLDVPGLEDSEAPQLPFDFGGQG